MHYKYYLVHYHIYSVKASYYRSVFIGRLYFFAFFFLNMITGKIKRRENCSERCFKLLLIRLLCWSVLQNVIDGDLCEQFNSMDPHKQKSVAEELDRTPPEVSKKLEDIRTRYAF